MHLLQWLPLLSLAAAMQVDYWHKICLKFVGKNNAFKDIGDVYKGTELKEKDALYYGYGHTPDFMLSLYQCYNDGADLLPEGQRESAVSTSWNYFAWQCRKRKAGIIWSHDKVKEEYARTQITTSYAEANSTGKAPFKVKPDSLKLNLVPAKHYYQARRFDIVFGEALIYYVCGIMFLAILFNLSSWLLPRGTSKIANFTPIRTFRRHVTLAPLLSGRAANWLKLYNPRLPHLTLLGLFVLNYTFLATKMHYDAPSALYDTKHEVIGTFLAYRSAFLLMFKLPFLFLFPGRNNFLIWLTGWDQRAFVMLHKGIARMVVIDGLIHMSAYCVKYGVELMDEWKKPVWQLGFCTIVLFVLMAVHGFRTLRHLGYDLFVFFHVTFAIASVVTLYYHLNETDMTKQLWYTAVALWGADRLARFGRVLLSGASSATASESGDCITMYVKNRSFLKPYSGCHYYVYFVDPLYFWQSHPFTAEPTEYGLKFVFKVRNGMTKRIQKRIQRHGPTYDFKVVLEGPYGVPYNFDSFERLAFFAGGIGITAVFAHLRGFAHRDNTKSISVHWAVSDRQALSWYADELGQMIDAGFKVFVHPKTADLAAIEGDAMGPIASSNSPASSVTKEDKEFASTNGASSLQAEIVETRLNIHESIARTVDEAHESLAVFACGPPAFNQHAREAVTHHLLNSRSYVQFYEEAFT